MTEPIKPNEVAAAKAKALPGEVIDVFNELIAKHWNGTSSQFTQREAQTIICDRMQCQSTYLFDNGYMDVEPVYEAIGWTVYYDKPGYNEQYDAIYNFSKQSNFPGR